MKEIYQPITQFMLEERIVTENEALLLLRDCNYRTPHVPIYLDSIFTVGLMNFLSRRRETKGKPVVPTSIV